MSLGELRGCTIYSNVVHAEVLHSSKLHFVHVLSVTNTMLLKLATATMAFEKILSILKSKVKLSLNPKVIQAANGVSGLFPRKHR